MIHENLERSRTVGTGYSSEHRRFIRGTGFDATLASFRRHTRAQLDLYHCPRPGRPDRAIVFLTALGEVVIGTTAVLALFQTIGSLGEAKGLFAHAEAVATTALVLIIATTIMSSWLFAGAWLVQASIP